MPAGPGGKDVVVEFLAHDSSHRPAEADDVVAVEFARAFDHETLIPRQSRKIKRCAEVGCSLEANPSLKRIRCRRARNLVAAILSTLFMMSSRPLIGARRTFCDCFERSAIDPEPTSALPAGSTAFEPIADKTRNAE